MTGGETTHCEAKNRTITHPCGRGLRGRAGSWPSAKMKTCIKHNACARVHACRCCACAHAPMRHAHGHALRRLAWLALAVGERRRRQGTAKKKNQRWRRARADLRAPFLRVRVHRKSSVFMLDVVVVRLEGRIALGSFDLPSSKTCTSLFQSVLNGSCALQRVRVHERATTSHVAMHHASDHAHPPIAMHAPRHPLACARGDVHNEAHPSKRK